MHPAPLPAAAWLPDAAGCLQSPAVFLAAEAAMADEELAWEVEEGEEEAPGLRPTSVKLRLTYFEETVEVEEASEAAAVARAARETLRTAGPWVAPAEVEAVTTAITAALPMAMMAWLPPRYDAEHVSTADPATGVAWAGEVAGRSLYRATVVLGPLTLAAVAATLFEAVASLGKHAASLLRTRDLAKLTSEVEDKAREVYVRGQDVLVVVMEGAGEGGRPAPLLPPLDLHLLQPRLAGGRLPPGYGARDEYGCMKVLASSSPYNPLLEASHLHLLLASSSPPPHHLPQVALCQLCSCRLPATHEALLQVSSLCLNNDCDHAATNVITTTMAITMTITMTIIMTITTTLTITMTLTITITMTLTKTITMTLTTPWPSTWRADGTRPGWAGCWLGAPPWRSSGGCWLY